MQWLLNLLFKLVDSAMSLFDTVEAPTFISDLTLAITKYCVIVNYYFPLDLLCSVALTVIAFVFIFMIVSALLQIF